MSEFKKTGDRNLLYLEAAGGVIREYTGMAAFAPQPVAKYLEAKQVGTGGDISYLFPLRVIFIGETLFLLRSCKGFQELCRRLKQQRDLRSAFYEARAAKRFFDAGYAIVFPESNKSRTRGNDFDFTVIKDGTLVNVEATALNENKEETILNALNKKRGQLSKDAPSVIFCLLPNPLDTQGESADRWTERIANRFLASTRRVNVVVMQIEHLVNIDREGARGGFFTVARAFFNHNPSHSIDLSFLFEGWSSPQQQKEMAGVLRDPDAHPGLEKSLRTSDFYKWVDSLVP